MSGSADTSRPQLDADRERLRLQVAWSWSKELQTLLRFGLRDGMQVLELGSGPGFVTEKLLEALPAAVVTAVEIEPAFLQWSRRYLDAKGIERVRFVQASAMNTGLPEASFDIVVARYLFQHVSDPIGVAREAYRVLKPGGKLVLIDNDKDFLGILDPPIAELEAVLKQRGELQTARGGDPMVGRKLWRILHAAGFEKPDLQAIVFHSDELGLDAFRRHFSVERMQPLVAAGLASQAEADAARAALERFWNAPEPLILQLLFMACGERPQS